MVSEEATKEKTTEASKEETPKKEAEATTTPVKRGPGAKEIPPMQWKLIGVSAGTPVILLKCIEKEDAEAQLKRLEAERYYDELHIYAIDAPMKMSAAQTKERQKLFEEAFTPKPAPKKAKSGKKAPPTQPTVIKAKAKAPRGGKVAEVETESKTDKKAAKKSTSKKKAAKTTKTAKAKTAAKTKKKSTTKKAAKSTAKKKTKAKKATKKAASKTTKAKKSAKKKKK